MTNHIRNFVLTVPLFIQSRKNLSLFTKKWNLLFLLLNRKRTKLIKQEINKFEGGIFTIPPFLCPARYFHPIYPTFRDVIKTGSYHTLMKLNENMYNFKFTICPLIPVCFLMLLVRQSTDKELLPVTSFVFQKKQSNVVRNDIQQLIY